MPALTKGEEGNAISGRLAIITTLKYFGLCVVPAHWLPGWLAKSEAYSSGKVVRNYSFGVELEFDLPRIISNYFSGLGLLST